MAISKAVVIEQALAILDEYGLADLSMRRLASALGVQAATIYWHFANKQALLAGVAGAVLADLAQPTDIAQWAKQLRAALLKHRDAAEIVAATLAIEMAERDPLADVVPLFIEKGYSEQQARLLGTALLHFVLGHVTQEQARQNLIDFKVLSSERPALDEASFAAGLAVFLAGLQEPARLSC